MELLTVFPVPSGVSVGRARGCCCCCCCCRRSFNAINCGGPYHLKQSNDSFWSAIYGSRSLPGAAVACFGYSLFNVFAPDNRTVWQTMKTIDLTCRWIQSSNEWNRINNILTCSTFTVINYQTYSNGFVVGIFATMFWQMEWRADGRFFFFFSSPWI